MEHAGYCPNNARREPSPFDVTEHEVFCKEPESLNVGQLNRVVRELREALYQQKLLTQAGLAAAAIAPAPPREAKCGNCGETIIFHAGEFADKIEAMRVVLARAHGLLDCASLTPGRPLTPCSPDNQCPPCFVAHDAEALLEPQRRTCPGCDSPHCADCGEDPSVGGLQP